jgi:hypothetical protein
MDCPTCRKSLSTEQGMRQHHTKVHGEPLPNRECEGCDVAFYDPKARKSYCEDCNPNAGKHNGNWKDARETTDCERCGDQFEYYPSDKKGVYCSECVEESDEFLGDHYAEVHDIEPETRTCEYCDEEFDILPCFLRLGGGRFCSAGCRNSWLSDQWGDGEAVYNGNWRPVRRAALERDGHQCQNCGDGPEEIGREPDVHHLKPVREFDDPQDAHELSNVVCLCPQCHAFVEHGTIPTSEVRPEATSRNE